MPENEDYASRLLVSVSKPKVNMSRIVMPLTNSASELVIPSNATLHQTHMAQQSFGPTAVHAFDENACNN